MNHRGFRGGNLGDGIDKSLRRNVDRLHVEK
jgi:hypothetical protein